MRDPDDPELQRDCAERLLAHAAERRAAMTARRMGQTYAEPETRRLRGAGNESHG